MILQKMIENEEIDEQEQMKYLHQESFETERNDDRKNIKQMFKIQKQVNQANQAFNGDNELYKNSRNSMQSEERQQNDQ